jgi:dihydrofolate reductase
MKVSLIAAMGENRELGLDNRLPWHLPDDLKRFKAITKNHAVIMGRKTYESIGKPLPNRKNIIVTRNKNYKAEGCTVVNSIEEAINEAGDDHEVFVIGGSEIYAAALPRADKMYLTFVATSLAADARFPEFNEKEWRILGEEPHARDEKHPHSFVYKVYERIKS